MLVRERSARLSGGLQRRCQTCFTVPSKPLSAQNVAARIRGVASCGHTSLLRTGWRTGARRQ